jgi:uncharacterized protein DUF6644
LREFLSFVQTSRLAVTIGESIRLTAFLSGIHLVGLTLLVGSVVVSSLRLLGLAFRDRPVGEISGAGGRGIILGIVISMTSGLLLVTPRIVSASENTTFQLKMMLLCAAIAFYFTVYRRAIAGHHWTPFKSPVIGAIGLALWLCVAVAGCAFILLE